MSEPNRYRLAYEYGIHVRNRMAPDGEFVLWEDYARLKAEVERLTERNNFLEQIDSYPKDANEHSFEQRCNELEAEVERLTAQRAKLIESAEQLFRFIGEELYGPIDHFEADWNAAKEGKPSV